MKSRLAFKPISSTRSSRDIFELTEEDSLFNYYRIIHLLWTDFCGVWITFSFLWITIALSGLCQILSMGIYSILTLSSAHNLSVCLSIHLGLIIYLYKLTHLDSDKPDESNSTSCDWLMVTSPISTLCFSHSLQRFCEYGNTREYGWLHSSS